MGDLLTSPKMGDGKCFGRKGGEMTCLFGREEKWVHLAKAHVGTNIG
jgi:hypothetical protein